MTPSESPEVRPPRCLADNTGKRMSKRRRAFDRSTVVISYNPQEAQELRKLAASIRLADDTSPSLSLLSRRALQMYCAHLVRHRAHFPAVYANELAELEKLVARRVKAKVKRDGIS